MLLRSSVAQLIRGLTTSPVSFAAHAHAHRCRIRYAMSKVYWRLASDNTELHINFRYANEELRVDRDFNFCRRLDENVDNAIERIRNNLEKELTKRAKKGKKKSTPAEVVAPCPSVPIVVELLQAGADKPLCDITFAEVLSTANGAPDLQLRVLDQTYTIVLNEPWVANLTLPGSALAGYDVYPTKVELQFAEREHCRGAWYKAKMPASGDMEKGAQWQHCADGLSYRTSNDDVGYYIKFELTPGNGTGNYGPAVAAVTKREVQAGPGPCPFETRHCFTQSRLSGDNLRVVSYNLLADLYADSDFSRTNLFPYCPAYALHIDYRKQLFLKELLGYNADIICLQEVDMKIFDYDLRRVLEAPQSGDFIGVMAQKGSSGEGVATFYRKDRFRLLQSWELNIGNNIRTLPEFAELWQQISGNEKLIERICDRAQTLQVCLLQCLEHENRYLLVANTHLYFHPDADHIRLLQMGFSMLYVAHLHEHVQREHSLPSAPSLIFCGDFNSVPECGIYKLMTERFVGADCVDWSSNAEEAVRGVSLAQPFSIKSACGTPAYTNYTHAFAACLDYIFYQSDRLQVVQVVPLPTDEELKAHIAIPSVVFPSDHVALVADLKFHAS